MIGTTHLRRLHLLGCIDCLWASSNQRLSKRTVHREQLHSSIETTIVPLGLPAMDQTAF